MAQVLKEEIRNRIMEAALEEFFTKDYRSCTMREIALKAQIPTGLIYSYFKSKEVLFEEVISPVLFYRQLGHLQVNQTSTESSRLNQLEQESIQRVFTYYKEFIILMDKSQNTIFAGEKEKIIQLIEAHMWEAWAVAGRSFDSLMPRIMSVNYVESIIEIARNYESVNRCNELLAKVTKLLFPKEKEVK